MTTKYSRTGYQRTRPWVQSTHPHTHQVRCDQNFAVASQLGAVTLNLQILWKCGHRVRVDVEVTMRMR